MPLACSAELKISYFVRMRLSLRKLHSGFRPPLHKLASYPQRYPILLTRHILILLRLGHCLSDKRCCVHRQDGRSERVRGFEQWCFDRGITKMALVPSKGRRRKALLDTTQGGPFRNSHALAAIAIIYLGIMLKRLLMERCLQRPMGRDHDLLRLASSAS